VSAAQPHSGGPCYAERLGTAPRSRAIRKLPAAPGQPFAESHAGRADEHDRRPDQGVGEDRHASETALAGVGPKLTQPIVQSAARATTPSGSAHLWIVALNEMAIAAAMTTTRVGAIGL